MTAYQFHDVGMFHHKFGLDMTTQPWGKPGPRELPTDLMEFRLRFLCEELQEIFEGCGFEFGMTIFDLVKKAAIRTKVADDAQIFDGLIDLVYVAYGLAHLRGYPWEEGWTAVQHANMQKQRAERADQSERGGTWDIIKPEGWTAPDIHVILEGHGWYPEDRAQEDAGDAIL